MATTPSSHLPSAPPTIVFRATFNYLSRYPKSRLFGRLSDWNQLHLLHPSHAEPISSCRIYIYNYLNHHQGRCAKSRLLGHLPNWPCATSIAEPFHDTDPATTRPSVLNPSASISRPYSHPFIFRQHRPLCIGLSPMTTG